MKISLTLFVTLVALHLIAANDDFMTCDFDLVPRRHDPDPDGPIPWKREYFVGICSEVYANKATEPAMYEEFLREAKAFRDFTKKLENYEVKKSGKPLCKDGVYYEDTEFRKKLYRDSKLFTCYGESVRDDFLKCLRNKRKEMTQAIPDV